MSELNWNHHIEASLREQAEAAKQRAESEALDQQKAMETSRILHGMDHVVKDFLKSAEEQGFPGANPYYIKVPRKLGGGYRGVQRGLSYSWQKEPSYGEAGEPISAFVVSNGEWFYLEATDEDTSNYNIDLICRNKASRLEALKKTGGIIGESRYVSDTLLPEKLMSVLARIAIDNGIQLSD